MKIVTADNVDHLMQNLGKVINSEPFASMMDEYHNKIFIFLEKLIINLKNSDPLGIFIEMQKSYYEFNNLINQQDKLRDFMTSEALKMD